MTELRQRTPRVECKAFLAFVRRKSCCVCHAPAPSQAAHIRMPCLGLRKEYTGKAQKPDDRWTTPLCFSCHIDQHGVSEVAFWRDAGLDPFAIAVRLWAQFERHQKRTPEQHEKVVKRAARQKRRSIARPKRIVSGMELRGRLSSLTAARPMRNANRWPPKKSRKIQNRRRP